MSDFDPYKTLQVDSEADIEVIQAAYRRLARKYHPDLAADAATAERMKSLNAAWELLRDPSRRAAYDAERSSRIQGSPDRGLPRRPGPNPGDSRSRSAPSDAPDRTRGSDGGRPAGGGAGHVRGQGGGAAGSQTDGQGGAPERGERGEPGQRREPEGVPRDWTSGRSSFGSGYDPSTMRAADGFGAAGPPPGGASGSVLNFGRYAGWSLGEIARKDIEYLEWLDRVPIGRQYRDEIDRLLRQRGLRRTADAQEERRGLFRRR